MKEDKNTHRTMEEKDEDGKQKTKRTNDIISSVEENLGNVTKIDLLFPLSHPINGSENGFIN